MNILNELPEIILADNLSRLVTVVDILRLNVS